MHKRPSKPKGGFHQAEEIAEVILYILYKSGSKGQYVELNEPLKEFGITHPGELGRTLLWLIEKPRASVFADPHPRTVKYGEWDRATLSAVITMPVSARLTAKGLEDYHRQRDLISIPVRSKWALLVPIAVLLVSMATFCIEHWKLF